MFTGIIEELGIVDRMETRATGARLTIQCSTVLADLLLGGSIAVNGVCLTAVEITESGFAADLAPETLSRSSLGSLVKGSHVNLERPVTPVTRLSGHLVQGHVDGTGYLTALDSLGDGNWWLSIRVQRELVRYLVEKGSVTLDGISLTIARLEKLPDENALVGVTIIPHTFSNTTLGTTKAGAKINVEVDVLAKHVERLLETRLGLLSGL